MQSTKCPECRDEVSVPSGLPLDAELECPLCGSDYPFSRIAATLPPVLIVKSGGTGGTGQSSILGANTGADQSGGFAIKVGSMSGNDSMSFDSQPASFVSDSTGTTQSGPAKSRPPQPGGNRKKEKNMVVEGLKIVLGGLLAFPLVQLGVWWIAGRDPLDLGPSVSKIVPFVVPQKHRGIFIDPTLDDEGNEIETDESKTASKNERTESKPRDRSVDTGSRKVDHGANNSANNSGKPNGLESNPNIVAESSLKTPERVKIDVAELMKEKNLAHQYATPQIKASLTALAPPKNRNTIGQLNESLTSFLRSTFDSNGEATEDIQDDQYAKLVDLAEHLAGVQGDDGQVENALATTQLALAQVFPRSLNATSIRGKKAFDDKKNVGSGIAVCGSLKSVATSSDIVHARIAWAHEPASEVDIYTRDLSLGRASIESPVVALGRIVDGKQIALEPGPAIVATVTVLLN